MPHESTGCIANVAASGENSRRFCPLPVPAVNATSSPVVFYPESLAIADAEEDIVVPGGEEPATGIPEEECKAINLGYRDPASIRPEEFANREQEGVLWVPKAGEMLYHLRQRPDWARET